MTASSSIPTTPSRLICLIATTSPSLARTARYTAPYAPLPMHTPSCCEQGERIGQVRAGAQGGHGATRHGDGQGEGKAEETDRAREQEEEEEDDEEDERGKEEEEERRKEEEEREEGGQGGRRDRGEDAAARRVQRESSP